MTPDVSIATTCDRCGTPLTAGTTACPHCGRLVYAEHLANLSISAKHAADTGDISAALADWREALSLLPPDSKQAAIVIQKINELDAALAAPAAGKPGSKVAAGLGAAGLLLLKFKTLLLGLTKFSTLSTMFLSFGVYISFWGWQFAAGFVLSIYVHEMGHVIALRKYGFKATAPMFIPGLGALIRLKQQIVNPREDAEIGLAEPIYGLGAAVFSLGIWELSRFHVGGLHPMKIFAAIAGVGAWVNLFNLLPVYTLDGGRGFSCDVTTATVCRCRGGPSGAGPPPKTGCCCCWGLCVCIAR